MLFIIVAAYQPTFIRTQNEIKRPSDIMHTVELQEYLIASGKVMVDMSIHRFITMCTWDQGYSSRDVINRSERSCSN